VRICAGGRRQSGRESVLVHHHAPAHARATRIAMLAERDIDASFLWLTMAVTLPDVCCGDVTMCPVFFNYCSCNAGDSFSPSASRSPSLHQFVVFLHRTRLRYTWFQRYQKYLTLHICIGQSLSPICWVALPHSTGRGTKIRCNKRHFGAKNRKIVERRGFRRTLPLSLADEDGRDLCPLQ